MDNQYRNAKIEAIIFDFDGTLANTIDLSFSVYHDLAKKFRLKPLTREKMIALKEMSAQEVFRELGVTPLKAPFVIADGRRRLAQFIGDVRVDTELATLIRQIGPQTILGIVSSNSKKNVEKFLNNNQLDCFDFIAGSTRIFGKKHALTKVIKKHRLNPDKVLYVGDEVRDIVAAKACNMIPVSVSWGYNTSNALLNQAPAYHADSPTQLNDIILGLLQN